MNRMQTVLVPKKPILLFRSQTLISNDPETFEAISISGEQTFSLGENDGIHTEVVEEMVGTMPVQNSQSNKTDEPERQHSCWHYDYSQGVESATTEVAVGLGERGSFWV